MHPTDKLTPTADAIEQEILHPCCLREDNLYVAEWVDYHKMVRTCRRCHAKHTTARLLPGVVDLGWSRLSTLRTEKGRRHFTMGLQPGRFTPRRGPAPRGA